jgi:hypothetical protein
MIEETIEKLERSLSENTGLEGRARTELQELLAKLRTEVGELAKTDQEKAGSIAGFAVVSTHEATRSDPDPELRELSIKGLMRSVSDFEGTHPALVRVVNNICNTLSNLGI